MKSNWVSTFHVYRLLAVANFNQKVYSTEHEVDGQWIGKEQHARILSGARQGESIGACSQGIIKALEILGDSSSGIQLGIKPPVRLSS